jgi:hypothetical protein
MEGRPPCRPTLAGRAGLHPSDKAEPALAQIHGADGAAPSRRDDLRVVRLSRRVRPYHAVRFFKFPSFCSLCQNLWEGSKSRQLPIDERRRISDDACVMDFLRSPFALTPAWNWVNTRRAEMRSIGLASASQVVSD